MFISVEFDDWFQDQVESDRGVTTTDVVSLVMNMMARLRTKLTSEELEVLLLAALDKIEDRLQAGTAFLNHDGTHKTVLLAEERRVLGMEEIEVPDTIAELEA